jgi:hypothetical protein
LDDYDKGIFECFECIYVSELHEEAPMDNEQHWKRGKETFHRYLYILQRRKIIRKRDLERKISSMQTGETYPQGELFFFL